MPTRLEIIVSAVDEASGTMNKVAASGKRVGTSLNAAGTQGGGAIGTLNRVSSGFVTTLGKVAKYVGVAFAVTEVVRFGKAALEAYNALERQENLVAEGLKRIGDANQFPQLERDLRAVSDRTVTLQGDTQQVAAAVLNVGHNYFAALGPSASHVLSGLVQGILNISAATHKSLGMLQRTLTLSIINTPDKAIGTLQKLGLATEEQASKWKDLAAAGQLDVLRQQEINAVTNAYPNAAGKAATTGDRMRKTMDDLKVSIGAVLTPLEKVANGALGFIARNLKLVTVLGSVVAALYVGQRALGAFAGWALNAGAATEAMGASAATAAGMIDSMLGPIALASAGLLLLVGNFHSIMSSVTRVDDVLGPHLRGVLTELSDNLRDGKLSLNEYNRALDELQQQHPEAFFDVLLAKGAAKAEAATHAAAVQIVADVKHVVHSTSKFAGMGEKDFRTWAKSVKSSAHTSILSLGGVALATHKTARAFLHDSDVMAQAAKQDAKAMKRLASESQSWVPDQYKQWLVTQGPGAVANFEQLTSKSQRQAVSDWKAATGGAAQYAGAINKLSPNAIDAANVAAKRLATTIESLVSKPYYLDVYIRQHGTVPNPTGTTTTPPGGPGNPAPPGNPTTPGTPKTPTTINVNIDRRRVVAQSDYEVAYRGF